MTQTKIEVQLRYNVKHKY